MVYLQLLISERVLYYFIPVKLVTLSFYIYIYHNFRSLFLFYATFVSDGNLPFGDEFVLNREGETAIPNNSIYAKLVCIRSAVVTINGAIGGGIVGTVYRYVGRGKFLPKLTDMSRIDS